MDNTTIEVKKGVQFSIDVKEMPSAGYISKLKIDSEKINFHSRTLPDAKPFDLIDPKEMAIGGESTVRYTFSTKEVGEFEIKVRLLRPWVGEAEDDEQFIYKIIST